VRFDEHAIYLGDPASNQACPSLLVGATEALLVQPAPRSSVLSSVEDPVARQITVTAPRIKVTATFDADPGRIDQILGSASLPSPIMEAPDPVAAPVEPAATAAPDLLSPLSSGLTSTLMSAQKAPVPALSERVANYRGLGFDACAAPSAAYMSAWLRQSPYRERLGFGRGTPIYYDMEAYSPGLTARTLRFLSAWTSRLHALGYSSGVYSSSSAGIAALARVYPSHRYAMPDVIFDALWNGKKNTADGQVVVSEWPNHHRVHQFSGDVTQSYGGDAISIDEDYLNVKLSASDPAPLSSAIRPGRGRADVFYQGTSATLGYLRSAPGWGWVRPVR
jgi:hypothetical protein